MKEIKENIKNLQNSISKIDDKEYKELFKNVENILSSLSNKIEELMTNQAVLADKLNCIDDDIVDIQDELFEEVSIEELEEMEDDYKEISCKNCGKPIYIENSTLQKESKIPCPYCGENIK